MKHILKSSKVEQGEPVVPAADAGQLYRRYLRLRAEEDLSSNTNEGVDFTVTKPVKTRSEDILS
jgi:hypothetical protein